VGQKKVTQSDHPLHRGSLKAYGIILQSLDDDFDPDIDEDSLLNKSKKNFLIYSSFHDIIRDKTKKLNRERDVEEKYTLLKMFGKLENTSILLTFCNIFCQF
jgi:hypothetical protein